MSAHQAPKKIIIDHGQNKLAVLIDGEYKHLKVKTLHQVQEYERWCKTSKEREEKEASLPDSERVSPVRKNHRVWLELAQIALNPKPGVFILEPNQIEEKFDSDEIELIGKIWLSRFLEPRVQADPHLAP